MLHGTLAFRTVIILTEKVTSKRLIIKNLLMGTRPKRPQQFGAGSRLPYSCFRD